MIRRFSLFYPLFLIATVANSTAIGQPSAADALRLEPMQAGVTYDTPTPAEIAKCKVSADEQPGETAWVVSGAAGETLRRFVDSNGDNKVDEWRYFRGGIEVYRDVDKDFNGKADQYRWLGTAGTRWGLDTDEDGQINTWKEISPEEVSAEVIEAIKERDKQRFLGVLLNSQELASLGLGKRMTKELVARTQEAAEAFNKVAVSQESITSETQWIDFGGLRPGTIPAGNGDFSKDVTVYENVVAMIETAGQPAQVPIGTLVKIGAGWRVVGLPIAKGADAAPEFVFFEPANQPETVGVSEKTEQLIKLLEKIDVQLAATKKQSELAALNLERANALEALALEANSVTDREMWWMQFADTVGTAAQSGTFPNGTQRLAKLRKQLESTSSNKELLSHVTFTHMSADYAERLQAEDADFSEVQDLWLKELDAFITKYPKSSNAAEAILQLALAKEFAGEEDEANKWYTKIVTDFAGSPLSAKAAGAKRRLESVGKTLQLKGRTVEGKAFDITKLRGKTVLVHYWATWCGPCKQDMEIMKDLQKEYKKELEIVGVNVDSQTDELARFFRTERPQWTHLYEEGGLDSRLAAEMGVFTLPVMMLVDERGRVVNRQLHGAQLRAELEKRLR